MLHVFATLNGIHSHGDCTAVCCVRMRGCARMVHCHTQWGWGVQDIQERVRRRVNLGIGSSFDGFNVVRETGWTIGLALCRHAVGV